MVTIKDFKLNPIEHSLIEFTNSLYEEVTFDKISKEEMRDILSSGQIISKKWLLQELHNVLKNHLDQKEINIAVTGGWLGFLSAALCSLDERIYVDSYDLDPRASFVAAKVLIKSAGKAIIKDMYDIYYADYDCIVNTSTEHITNIANWSSLIPKGKLVVAQGNNERAIKDHISCVDSAEELAKKLQLTEILFSGELVFPFYTRYMVIGKK